VEGCSSNMERKAERLRRSGRLGKGRSEGLGCGKVE
jgi:hypothetical protein